MTIEELRQNKDYTLHHTATMMRYVSRKIDGIVEPYSGRFGEGYIVMRPRWDTTRYCYVDYYILETN